MRLNIKRKIDSYEDPQHILNLLLEDRNISDTEQFTNPPHPQTMDFEFFFEDKAAYSKQLKKVIKHLETIKKNNESVVVYSDYDADGITGGAVLWETLHLLGFNVMPHVPDRKKEGYGFSKRGIDSVKKKYNPKLIISVDHGIAAADHISYAKNSGIPIIVTDHHQKSEKKPDDALAIFHTDQLSGSGVAYFFAKELFKHFSSQNTKYEILNTNFRNDYVSLAAIGLIADLVPLTGVARSVAKHGLQSISKSQRYGITELLQEANIHDKQIGTYEVGFMIAPRINACGRLSSGLDALRLLCTNHPERAKMLAKKAGEINKKRQELVEVACEEAIEMVDTAEKILIVYNKQWEEGIIGLIASKLVEKYKRPTIAMTDGGTDIKGSARSIRGFDITEFLRLLQDDLVSVGGHKAAAGFLLEKKSHTRFIKNARALAQKKITDNMLIQTLDVDMALPLYMATVELARNLSILEPFGIGNPKPVFYSKGAIIDIKLIGKKKNHLKLFIKEENSFPLEILFFGEGKQYADLSPGQTIQVVYSLDVNRWNGAEKVSAIGKYLSRG